MPLSRLSLSQGMLLLGAEGLLEGCGGSLNRTKRKNLHLILKQLLRKRVAVADSNMMMAEQYTTLLETLAEKCAGIREKERDQRRYQQRDPDIQRRNPYHAQSVGYMKALAESLRKLQHTPERRFDPQDFAEWCWRQHQHTNEWRTEATGITEQAAKGWHNGFGFVLDAIKENSNVEHEDFADSFEVATV